MKAKLFYGVIVVLITITGCSSSGGSSGESSDGVFTSINITDAKSLFIGNLNTSHANNMRASSESKGLFKITDDGYVNEVEYQDEEGNILTNVETPSNICDINKDFLMLDFPSGQYLVNKTTGSVYQNPYRLSAFLGLYSSFINTPPILYDSSNNLYYRSPNDDGQSSKIVKINTTDPNNLVKYDSTPVADNPAVYAVSLSGTLIYTNNDRPIFGKTRIKIENSYQNLVSSGTIYAYWFGLDNKLRYIEYDNGYKLDTLIVNSNSTISKESSISTDVELYTDFADAKMFKFQDAIVIVGMFNNKIFKVEPSISKFDISSTGVSSYTLAEQSSSYFYLYGNQTLIKINPINGSKDILMDSSDNLDFYSFYVDNSETVFFSALRMTDGAYVLGKIEPSGLITISQEYADTATPVSLVKIQ